MEYSNHPINLKIVTFIFGQRLYDNIPFVTYIKEVTELDTLIIKREEIELYIKENNIKLKNHYLKSITPLFFNK